MRCIQSIVDTADSQDSFEICLRLHRDDHETIQALPRLLYLAQKVRVVIGLPMSGYGDLSRFYDEAIAIANGDWIWVMNDDVTVEGNGWDTKLAAEPTDKFIIMPEIHKLGGSTYENDFDTPFMMLPNGCWKQYGVTKFSTPFDHGLWKLLRDNGWGTRFLKGIATWHDRDETDKLENERNPANNSDRPLITDPEEHHMENL